jgi:hypothetical protein
MEYVVLYMLISVGIGAVLEDRFKLVGRAKAYLKSLLGG